MLAWRSRAICVDDRAAEIPPDRVAAERQGQAGVLQPPRAEIGPEVEAGVGVGELALVDQQPDVHLAPLDRVLDPVERHHDRHDVRLIELERQVGGGQLARARRPGGPGARRVDRPGAVAWRPAGPVAVAHGGARAEERVVAPEIGVGVDRDRGHLELRAAGALVERLDIRQLVHVAQVAGVDLALRQRVEHERVVGVGAVGDADGAGHGVALSAWRLKSWMAGSCSRYSIRFALSSAA